MKTVIISIFNHFKCQNNLKPEIDDFYFGLEYTINRNEPRIPILV